MRWYVSQYMKMGCAAAIDMVRYILSWFLAPLTSLPSAAASDNSFRRKVRIWGEKISLVNVSTRQQTICKEKEATEAMKKEV